MCGLTWLTKGMLILSTEWIIHKTPACSAQSSTYVIKVIKSMAQNYSTLQDPSVWLRRDVIIYSVVAATILLSTC